MRILIANEALSGGGGVETYLATLVPALLAAGHEVGVLHDNPASEGGPQRIAPEGTWSTGVQDEGLDEAIARVRGFAPDACYSHNMRTLAIDARLVAEWPVVKFMHGHFGTCVSGQKAFGFPAIVGCTRSFGPGCLAHYLPRRCGQANPLVMMREYRWGSEQRSLFDRYRAIVVASRFMRDEYLAAGVAPDHVHAIPLFAPPHAAGARPDEGPRPIDVLFLGRMTRLKGPDVLVEAAGHASARLGRRLSVVFAWARWPRHGASTRGSRAGWRLRSAIGCCATPRSSPSRAVGPSRSGSSVSKGASSARRPSLSTRAVSRSG